MAENYVQIQIKASDTAKPDLTALKAQLDELGAKVENAKVNVDDADAAAKLLALNAKLASLDKRAANPKITIAGAAKVEADIAAIDASLKHLGDSSATADVKVNTVRSRLMSLGGAVGSVTGVGDAMTAASSKSSMFQRVMAGAGLATGLLEPALAGVTVAAGGLASGIAAAGIGLGAFGAVAKANFTTAATAAKQVQNAQDTYTASIKAGIAPAKAYQAEQKAINKAYAELSPAQIKLSKEIGDVSNAWQAFVQKNTAGVSAVLTKGFGLLPKIFKDLQPLMAPVEKALSGIIDKLGKGLDSSGFKNFIDLMAKNTGPAIEKIATAIGHVVVGIGGILKAFMPVSQGLLSGLDAITAKFAKWGSTLSGHTGFQSLMSTFKSEVPLVVALLKNLGEALKNVISAMAGLATGSNSKALLQILVALSGAIVPLTRNTVLLRVALYALAAVDIGKKISGMFTGIQAGLQILSNGIGIVGKFGGAAEEASIGAKLAAAATRVWTGVQAAFDVVMSANPIMLVVVAIAALVAGVIYAYTHFQTFRTIVNDVGNFLKSVFVAALQAVETEAKGMVSAVTSAWNNIKSVTTTVWNAIKTAVTAAINAVSSAITSAFNVIKSIIQAAWTAVQSTTSSAWSAIKAAVSAAVSAVKATLNWFASLAGLFRGWWTGAYNAVASVVGTMLGFVRGIPGKIVSALGNLGSLLVNAGKAVIQGLINGIQSMLGSLGSVVSGIASKIASLKGPLPKDLTLLVPHGQAIMTGLMTGISSKIPALETTMGNVTHTIQGGVQGGGTAGAGGPAKIQLELVGGSTDPLLTWLRQAIRIRGGTGPNSVQAALGQSR